MDSSCSQDQQSIFVFHFEPNLTNLQSDKNVHLASLDCCILYSKKINDTWGNFEQNEVIGWLDDALRTPNHLL
jgi:hypothetical protein